MADGPPLTALLDSTSIAVVGASSRPGSAGERVIHHLAASGYSGSTVLISRREREIQGQPTYASLLDYPGPIDHALLLVPAAALEQAVSDCADKGVAAASIFAAGFAESGPDGERRQAELGRRAAARGVRLLGPNCLGVMNARTGLMATASSALETLEVRPGAVSVVSQSGAVGMHFVALLSDAGLGLNYYVSTGNEVDVTAAEVLDHIATDRHTEVALAYLEGVRDPDRFITALQRLRNAGKSVVAIKVGRTDRSSAAVASHTAALAGSDAVYDAVLRRLGVVRVDSLADAVDAAALVVSGAARRRRPDRVAVISVSGGMGALLAERLEGHGYQLPAPSTSARDAMLGLIPFCTPGNPIDVTGQITAEPERLAEFMALAAADDRWDAFAVALSYTVRVPRVYDVYREALLKHAAESDVVLAVTGLFDADQLQEMSAHGVVAGRDNSDIVRRLDLLRAVRTARDEAGEFRPVLAARPAAGAALPDAVAMTRMAAAGVPMARWRPVAEPADAPAAAADLGGAVALKLLVPGVLHKARAGNVRTGVGPADAEAIAAQLVAGAAPGAELVAQAMGPADAAEVIVGARRDDVFGLVFLVGRGGLAAEATADTAVLLPPVRREDLTAALAGLRSPLRTASGAPIDEDALWGVLAALAELATADPALVDAELNPVLVGVPGTGAVAVDAVIRVEPEERNRS